MIHLQNRLLVVTLQTRSLPRQWRYRATPQLAQRFRVLTTLNDADSTQSTQELLEYHYHNNNIAPPPARSQLRAVMLQSFLPMCGFGFMDQTIMIHAGNAIDCTIGVSLGLSTLAAAAVGQTVANTGGILFGETLQRFFIRFLWVQPPTLTAAQLSLDVVEKARFSGTLLGILAGCVLGLANLLFIDTQRSSDLKITKALTNGDYQNSHQHPFEVVASNQHVLCHKYQPAASTLIISGPDVDGILATVLTALNEEEYSVVEMSAKPKQENNNGTSNTKAIYEDIFVVRRKGEAIPEEELTGLVNKLLKERLPRSSPTSSTSTCANTTTEERQEQEVVKNQVDL